MAPSRTNSAQGKKIEESLRNSLPGHEEAFAKVKKLVGIPKTATLINDGEVIGNSHHRKTDVEFSFGNSHPLLRISVKSFKQGAGYNQLQRTSLRLFCLANKIKKADELFLQNLFLRKAKALEGRNTKLVENNEKDKVKQIFSRIEVGASAFLGPDHPQILALYNRNETKWKFYSFLETVLPLIRQQEISFTEQSANIKIGEYVVLQRKGSEKGEQGISGNRPVSDIGHRANDVQIKFRTKKFFNDEVPDAWYQLSISPSSQF